MSSTTDDGRPPLPDLLSFDSPIAVLEARAAYKKAYDKWFQRQRRARNKAIQERRATLAQEHAEGDPTVAAACCNVYSHPSNEGSQGQRAPSTSQSDAKASEPTQPPLASHSGFIHGHVVGPAPHISGDGYGGIVLIIPAAVVAATHNEAAPVRTSLLQQRTQNGAVL